MEGFLDPSEFEPKMNPPKTETQTYLRLPINQSLALPGVACCPVVRWSPPGRVRNADSQALPDLLNQNPPFNKILQMTYMYI